jgi:Domain of unknown function (DUF5667)/Calx-beta domain
LQSCLEGIRTGQETVDSALARYPERAEELRPLLEAASWLQMRSKAVNPSPDFVTKSRRRLEARLEREKAVGLSRAPRSEGPGLWSALVHLFSQKSFVYRFAIVTIFVFLFVVTTSSVAGAAQQAIPGDRLYPVKTSLERVNLALAFSQARRAQLHINYAERRLVEIRRLVVENRLEYLQATVNQFQSQAEQASLPLQTLESTNTSRAVALASQLKNVIDQQTESLPALPQDAPESARLEITRLLDVTKSVRNDAERIQTRVLGTPTPTAVVTSRTATPVPATPIRTETPIATQAPSATFTPSSTPSPSATLIAPTATATPSLFPTPTASPNVDETRVATTTLTPRPAPVVSFNLRSQFVTEFKGALLVTVQLEDGSGKRLIANQDVSVPFSISGSATRDLDYSVSSSPLVIPTGNSSANIIVNLMDDGTVEPDETIIISLGAPTNAVLGSPATYTITITHGPTVFFTLASQSVHENARSVDIEVQLVPVQATAVRVPFSLGGTAIQGQDYTLKGNNTLVIPAGQTKGNISLSLVADNLDEPNETVEVTLGSPSGANLSSPSTQRITLIDDDPQPEVTFAKGDQSVVEGTGDVSIQVQLSAASSLPITVPLSLSGSATPGIDFLFYKYSLVIPPGSSSASFNIQVLDDLLSESFETAVISMGQPKNAVLGMPNTYLLTIVDDDPQPEVDFVRPDQSVEESVGNVSVQIQLSALSSLPITVPLSLSGSATPGIDFIFNRSYVVIPPGSSSASLNIQVLDDLLPESYETVVIALGQPTNAVLGMPNAFPLTLVDNDPQPEVNFVQSNQSVDESVGTVSIQLQLSSVSSLPITVPLSLSGSATPGIDFLFDQDSVVFPPGNTGASLAVQVIDDLLPEPSETVEIALGQPTNAVTGMPITQTITILPSDQPTCNIMVSNKIVFSADNQGLEWTLSNLGTDSLILTQLTISWPTGILSSPNLSKVYLDNNLIFTGSEPVSPQTITSWIGVDTHRLLTSIPSTVILGFSQPILPGNYVMTLVFHDVTLGFDCAPVIQSIDRP